MFSSCHRGLLPSSSPQGPTSGEHHTGEEANGANFVGTQVHLLSCQTRKFFPLLRNTNPFSYHSHLHWGSMQCNTRAHRNSRSVTEQMKKHRLRFQKSPSPSWHHWTSRGVCASKLHPAESFHLRSRRLRNAKCWKEAKEQGPGKHSIGKALKTWVQSSEPHLKRKKKSWGDRNR